MAQMTRDEMVATVCNALSHPARVQMARLVSKAEDGVTGPDLRDQTELTQGNFQAMVRVLVESGIVRGFRNPQDDRIKIYELADSPVARLTVRILEAANPAGGRKRAAETELAGV